MTTDTTIDTAPPRIFNEDGTPAREVCHRCGYALIGLPRDNPCSECGTPPLEDIYIAFGGKKPLHPGWYVIPLIVLPLAYAFKAPNLTAMWIGTVVLIICVGASMLIEIAYNSRSAEFPAPLQFRFNHAGAIETSGSGATISRVRKQSP
jgi:hypothetical protein